MLREISDSKALKLVKDKKYIAFYIPLHLEFIKRLSTSSLSDNDKVTWFRFSFNCALAQSVILEVSAILDDLYKDDILRTKTEYQLAQDINQIWCLDADTSIHQFSEIREKVSKLYYSLDPLRTNTSNLPSPFTHSLGSSLASISARLCNVLKISPTWILCVDEAEFLEECYQRCINTAFRSDSDRITIKMATLPYYYTTRKTLDDFIEVMNGQDFNYSIMDMKYDGEDFVNVTNSIVRTRFSTQKIDIIKLEQFVKTLGDDNYLDYYCNEFGKDKSSTQSLQTQIVSQLSDNSQKHNKDKSDLELKKPVFHKLAPIFYIREIYKKKNGRYIPGWYAGASMVRRVAQGNPRIFIRIMNDLYNKAAGQDLPLGLKQQHQVIEDFAKSFCRESETLESVGRQAKKYLDFIAESMHSKTHEGKLVQMGLSFKVSREVDLSQHLLWLQKCVAFSRLLVDYDSLATGVSLDSKFELSNLYAVHYWLPMRANTPIRISLPPQDRLSNTFDYMKSKSTAKYKVDLIPGQLSLISNLGESYDEN